MCLEVYFAPTELEGWFVIGWSYKHSAPTELDHLFAGECVSDV